MPQNNIIDMWNQNKNDPVALEKYELFEYQPAPKLTDKKEWLLRKDDR
jgi:hypothetical protein